jgi:hypothetical protein
MARSRKGSAAGADPRPIVTYSHVPTDLADGRVEPRGLDPDSGILDAVEVPLVADAEPGREVRAAPDLRATDHAAPDIRADLRGDSFEPDEAIAAAAFEPEPRRRRGGRMLFIVAFIALAGGAGAIAASFGVLAPPKTAATATPADPAAELIAIHKQIDALGDASTPEAQAELARLTKRLAELEQSGVLLTEAPAGSVDATPAADVGPTVRKISLSPQDEDAAPAMAPPAPRPRPAKVAPAVAEVPPSDEDVPAAWPMRPSPARTGAPKAVLEAPARPASPANDDNFIASVEKALADSAGNRANGAEPAPLAPQPMGEAGAAPMGADGLQLPAAPPPLAAAPPSEDAPIVISPPAAEVAPLPRLDADVADPFALPAPVAKAEPPPKLPPGLKLPPAEIPNVAPSDQQY